MIERSWPFQHREWADPPWIMTGNMLTVWYEIDVADLRPYVHESLLPQVQVTTARARLYAISAETGTGEVQFSEVVLAFSTDYAGTSGEVSYAMWTDSVEYLLWGREVYGWPLRLAEFSVPDEFWSTGQALDCPFADLQFRFEDLRPGPASDPRPLKPWITPRRRLLSGSSAQSEDTVLLVNPTLQATGRRLTCEAEADVRGHWPSASFLRADLTEGFELCVDSAVQVVDRR